MPTKQLTSLTDIEDFARGATFFGTGGGGTYASGVEALKEQLDAGRPLGWVDIQDIDDRAYTASTFGMGSIAPKGKEIYDQIKNFDCGQPLYPRRADKLIHALKELERYTGKKVSAMVPGEIGGGNACICVAVATECGKLAVDGDYAGRAVPAIYQTGPYIMEKSLMPLASIDSFGNVVFIDRTCNWPMAERIGKQLSIAGFLGCGLAGFFMNGADMKQAVYPGTMTESYTVGKTIRKAREKKVDPVQAVVEHLGGWILTRGVVTKKEWWDKDGYYFGNHTFEGHGPYSGTALKVHFKNENHMCWQNKQVIATSPDMIIAVDNETAQPMINTEIQEGMAMAVIGVKARPMARSERGIQVLGPKNYGFDLPYIPIEQLLEDVLKL